MTLGFIYQNITNTVLMKIPSDIELRTETPVFITAESLRRSIINSLNGLDCDERLDFLRNYKVPTQILGVPVIYVPDMTPVEFSFGFEVLGSNVGHLYFRQHINGLPLFYPLTFKQNGTQIEYESGDYTVKNADYSSGDIQISMAFWGENVVGTGGFVSVQSKVMYSVERVVNIDIDYFLSLFPECEYPPLPNPNNTPQAIITPNDDINWREEWKMTLPPAQSKQPLANNTLPLNILRFLK